MRAEDLKVGMVIQLTGDEWSPIYRNKRIRVLKIDFHNEMIDDEMLDDAGGIIAKGYKGNTDFESLNDNGFKVIEQTKRDIPWL